METTLNRSANKYTIMALVLFVAVLLGAIFYVRPLMDEVGSLSLGRDDLVSQQAALGQKLTSLQKLQESLNQSTEVARETTLAAIPESFEQDKLILDLSRIAHDNDIILNGVNFSVPTTVTAGQIAKATISANLTGDETRLNGFLRDVEANQRKMVVKNIAIQVGETVEGNKRVNFSTGMEVYYQGSI